MANQDHLNVLLKGAEDWNDWRRANPAIEPDLSNADLSPSAISRTTLAEGNPIMKRHSEGANLRCANFESTNLKGSNLARATLVGADLRSADLSDADLSEATLFGAQAKFSILNNCEMKLTDLTAVDLSRSKGLTDEQIEVAIGNFQNVRLPSHIRKRPARWMECRDDVTRIWSEPCPRSLGTRNLELPHKELELVGVHEAEKTKPIVQNLFASHFSKYWTGLVVEFKRKSQSGIASAVIGGAGVLVSELIARFVFGMSWFDLLKYAFVG